MIGFPIKHSLEAAGPISNALKLSFGWVMVNTLNPTTGEAEASIHTHTHPCTCSLLPHDIKIRVSQVTDRSHSYLWQKKRLWAGADGGRPGWTGPCAGPLSRCGASVPKSERDKYDRVETAA